MAIEVKKEPDEFAHFPIEHCFFCHKPTRYWTDGGAIPVCRECAKRHDPKDLPKKDL